MPSWNDGSSSSQSVLGDITDLDYAPETVDDPTFCGVAVDCPELCRVHRLEPHNVVAFEGSNTGRRYYLCQVQNQVSNCGFVSWLDGEWPETMKNTLGRLWAMYNDNNSGRIDERIESAKLIKKLSDEKNKLDKKYSSLMDDVKKFMDATVKKVCQENVAKMNKEASEPSMEELKNEVEMLKNKVDMLKQVQISQADVMKVRQKKWDEEMEVMKEEKKKFEYMLFEMVIASDGNKDKLKKIKAICDE